MSKCTIAGCDNPARSSKTTVCEKHYYRKRRTGSYEILPRPKRVRPVCDIEDCDRQSRVDVDGTPVCDAHYKRWWRRGNFGSAEIASARPERGECIIDGCHERDDGKNGLCKLHGTRYRRHGDPMRVISPSERDVRRGDDNPLWTGDAASYAAIHQRLRAQRGPASALRCVDCGGSAKQWSYTRDAGESERQSEFGPYSISITHYAPRCVKCHKAFDLAAIGENNV